jgi:hypothetical protein
MRQHPANITPNILSVKHAPVDEIQSEAPFMLTELNRPQSQSHENMAQTTQNEQHSFQL